MNKKGSEFKKITDKMLDIHLKKSHDYGSSYDDSLDEEGLAAARVMLRNKWSRFKNLSKGNEIKVKDESIKDTLLDMANYAILTILWMNKNNK